MNNGEYPGNSKNPRSENEPKNIERVVTGEVVSKKKSLGRRFRDVFIGGDSSSVFEYVVLEVLIPQAKDMLAEAFTQGFERMIFGEPRSPRGRSTTRSSTPTNYTSYNRYAARGNNPVGRSDRETRTIVRGNLQSRDIDEIVLATRIEAETVLERMYDLLDDYEIVSVSDMKSLVGLSSSHVDNKWGWTTLAGSNVRRDRHGGYALDLPKPEPLD